MASDNDNTGFTAHEPLSATVDDLLSWCSEFSASYRTLAPSTLTLPKPFFTTPDPDQWHTQGPQYATDRAPRGI